MYMSPAGAHTWATANSSPAGPAPTMALRPPSYHCPLPTMAPPCLRCVGVGIPRAVAPGDTWHRCHAPATGQQLHDVVEPPLWVHTHGGCTARCRRPPPCGCTCIPSRSPSCGAACSTCVPPQGSGGASAAARISASPATASGPPRRPGLGGACTRGGGEGNAGCLHRGRGGACWGCLHRGMLVCS